MQTQPDLKLHEELLLLSLDVKKGSFSGSNVNLGLAAAVVAELLIDDYVTVDRSGKQRLVPGEAVDTGDPVLDAALAKIQASRKPKRIWSWLMRLQSSKQKRMIAEQLVEMGVLRSAIRRVLALFKTTRYHLQAEAARTEIDARLQRAIFTETSTVGTRTIVLISIADRAGVLKKAFDRKALKGRKDRIKAITEGEVVGAALKDAIDAMAVMSVVTGA